MRPTYAVATRNVAGVLAALVLGGPAASRAPGAPVAVSAKLSEWKVELSASTVPAGTVTFAVTNAGSIPHAFEIEGHGIEKETDQIQPGSTATLTLTLKLGTYEVYCPVGEGSHQKLGMETHLKAVAGQSSSGYGESAMGRSNMSEMGEPRATGEDVQSIRVTSGGPVIQILPGPFPFPDSAAPILQAFGDEREGLEAQVKDGPYSNNVAGISGSFTFTAWDKGAGRAPAGIAPRTRSKSCSCKSYPAGASRSSTRPAGSCSSTGKSPAPASRRAEEGDPMGFRTAVIGLVALGSLAGCGGYMASGPSGGNGAGGYGGGGGGGGGGV